MKKKIPLGILIGNKIKLPKNILKKDKLSFNLNSSYKSCTFTTGEFLSY